MRFRRHQEAAQAGTRRLLGLFVMVLVGLTLAVNLALALAYRLTAPWAGGYPEGFFATNTALVLLFVLGGCAVESLRLRGGGAHVARLAGAREARRDDVLERRLANVVAEMAIAANLRPPAAWVMPREDAINAFAAGWSHDDAIVAVTRGALERLDRAELQGVVAHEISHLAHGDTSLNMRLIGLVWGLRMLFDLGRTLTEPDDLGRRHVGVLFGLALMAVGSLGWVAGRLLQAAVSRQREFLADASAVKYTRQVAGLGGALRKIATQQREHHAALSARTGSLAHLLLVAPSAWRGWSSHPPLAERIRRLYGRTMPDMDAEALPRPAGDDEPSTVVSLVPIREVGRSGRHGDAPAVDAARHDPLQRLDLAAAAVQRAERESEALGRIERWRGPAELDAALRTLLQPAAAPADDPCWQRLPGAIASAMRADLVVLSPLSRVAVLDRLARHAAAWPVVQRHAFLRETAPRATTPAAAMRWLLVRQRLRARTLPFTPADERHALAAHADAAAVATAVIADGLGLGSHRTDAWRRRVRAALPVPEVDPATVGPRAVWHAWLRLQRLAAVQRPLPVRAWVQAWQADVTSSPADEAAAVLAVAALLLDVPWPPGLAGQLPPAWMPGASGGP